MCKSIHIPIIFLLSLWLWPSVMLAGMITVHIGDHKIHAELADTPDKRRRGLMYRTSMPEDRGMLFVLDAPARAPIWMKNTQIPLDIFWLSGNGTVLHRQSANPCVTQTCPILNPDVIASYILEINQGVVRAKIGDRVEILSTNKDSLPPSQ